MYCCHLSVDRSFPIDRSTSCRYILDVGKILEFIRKRSLHSMLESRYDLPSARIVTILLEERYLEQKDVAEMAMFPAKVRERERVV